MGLLNFAGTPERVSANRKQIREGSSEFQRERSFNMMGLFDFDRTPNWVSTNESDGQVFYGYDDDEVGVTEWYDTSGNLDSYTDIPSDDDCDDYLSHY